MEVGIDESNVMFK